MTQEDLERFTTAADAFLEACNHGQEAKETSGLALINILTDFYPRYSEKAWHYQGCLFFVQPSEPDSLSGVYWRLGVYPDDLVGEIVTDLEPEAGIG